jgi:HlyD family secretion protein
MTSKNDESMALGHATTPGPGLALIAAALIMASACTPASHHPPKYTTTTVSQGNIEQYVTATGSLGAVVSVDVGSQVSGKISALFADFNSPVKKGQLVAEIDPTVYAATLRQAQGDLASARAEVTLKKQNLERKKVLAPLRAASQLDLDQATAELAQAEATVEIKEAVVQSAQANLGYCKITAPVDGIVIARKIDLGQTVNAAMSTPVLFTVAQDIKKMNITADVSEADVGEVRLGQPVDFTVDAFPAETFHGNVVQVRKSPTTTQNVVTYQTIIAVDNPEQKLFPGMTADVSILVAKRDHVLKVSNTALRFTPPTNTEFEQPPPTKLQRGTLLVYTPVNAGAKLRAIVIKSGVTDGIDTEVLAGVDAGTALITSTNASTLANPFLGPQAAP